MNISSGQKLAILGLLLAGGGAAFVYLDPMDLDLLGLKPAPVIVQVPPPRPAPPKVTPSVAPVTPPPATTVTPAVPERTVAPPQIVEPASPERQSKPVSVKPFSPPSVDLRHCLELTENEAIAKCAGEQ